MALVPSTKPTLQKDDGLRDAAYAYVNTFLNGLQSPNTGFVVRRMVYRGRTSEIVVYTDNQLGGETKIATFFVDGIREPTIELGCTSYVAALLIGLVAASHSSVSSPPTSQRVTLQLVTGNRTTYKALNGAIIEGEPPP